MKLRGGVCLVLYSLLSDLSGCYDVIIFDVDCKNTSSGMSSPPPAFVEREMLTNTRELLRKDGKYEFIVGLALSETLPLLCTFFPSSSFCFSLLFPSPQNGNWKNLSFLFLPLLLSCPLPTAHVPTLLNSLFINSSLISFLPPFKGQFRYL